MEEGSINLAQPINAARDRRGRGAGAITMRIIIRRESAGLLFGFDTAVISRARRICAAFSLTPAGLACRVDGAVGTLIGALDDGPSQAIGSDRARC